MTRQKLSDGDRLRVRYNLGCGYANEALFDRSARDKHLSRADRYTRALLLDVLRHRLGDPGEVVRELADNMREPAVLLLAGIWAVAPQLAAVVPEGEHKRPATVTPDDALLCDVLYGRADERQARDLLRAVWGEAEPPSFLGDAQLAYNVACCYAALANSEPGSPETQASTKERRAADVQTAVSALAVAITDPALATWAPKDPWLSPLRGTAGWKDLFPPSQEVADTITSELDDVLRALGLTAVPVALALEEWEEHRVKLGGSTAAAERLSARVELNVQKLDSGASCTGMVSASAPGIWRAIRLVFGSVDEVIPLEAIVGRRDRARVFIRAFSSAPPDWKEIRLWLLTEVDNVPPSGRPSAAHSE